MGKQLAVLHKELDLCSRMYVCLIIFHFVFILSAVTRRARTQETTGPVFLLPSRVYGGSRGGGRGGIGRRALGQ